MPLMLLTPLPIMRDGPLHFVAQPAMTRAEALDWILEGRAKPEVSRLRPDPMLGLESDPQRRFLFDVRPDEFSEARPEFRQRYLLDGPQPTLVDQFPKWLPCPVRDEIIRLHKAGAFRRAALPSVRTFVGMNDPYSNIVVVWAGLDEFKDLYSASQRCQQALRHCLPEWLNRRDT
jgi:hypothetical protein